MRRVRPRLLTASLGLLSLACVPARANDTAIWGVGGAIRPMQEHPSIVMEKMDLRIDIYPETGRAQCDYVFHNTGPATTVRMGFPETVGGARKGRLVGFLSFATTVDGRAVPARVEGGVVHGPLDMRRWRVKTVKFGAGQKRRVSVSYTSELGVSLGNTKRRAFAYMVETGASWKGPIGSVRVHVVGHYDPNRNWLGVGPEFRRTGPTSFEWSTRDLEPKQQLWFSLRCDDIAVTFAGTRLYWGDDRDTYAYIRRGEAWLQARLAAEALSAEAEASDGEVVLTRGARQVRLRPGTRAVMVNGDRQALPGAPYLRRGRLMVPLRPIAVALGAEVAFDARERVTDVGYPALQEPTYRQLMADYQGRWRLRGYAPPELSEFDPTVAPGIPRPWACVGDFDGSGLPDAVFLLRKGGELRAGALVRSGKSWTFVWLPYREHVALRPGSVRTVLRLREPDGPARAHDGVELAAPGKPTARYYWDAAHQQFTAAAAEPSPSIAGGG